MWTARCCAPCGLRRSGSPRRAAESWRGRSARACSSATTGCCRWRARWATCSSISRTPAPPRPRKDRSSAWTGTRTACACCRRTARTHEPTRRPAVPAVRAGAGAVRRDAGDPAGDDRAAVVQQLQRHAGGAADLVLAQLRERADRRILPGDLPAHADRRGGDDGVLRGDRRARSVVPQPAAPALAGLGSAGGARAAAGVGGGADAGMDDPAGARRADQPGADRVASCIVADRPAVHRHRDGDRAGACADTVHGAGGVDRARRGRSGDGERGGVARVVAGDRVLPRGGAADRARHPVGRTDRVLAGGERLRDTGIDRRAAAEGRGDRDLRRVPGLARLAAGCVDRVPAGDRGGRDHAAAEPGRRATDADGRTGGRGGMRRNGPFALAFHAAFVVFMLAPLVVVFLVAFTPEGYLSLPLHGVSLRWFRAIGDNPDFIASFWLSIRLGLCAATLATAAILPAALAIGRRQFALRQAILVFVMSPLMVPAVVIGAYVLRMVLAAVDGLDANLDRAAVSLGATRLRAFWRVTVPGLLAGIAAGWMLAFISSFDELTVTVFVSSPQVTPLALRLFTHIAETTDPLVASVSAIIMGLTLVLLLLLDRLYGVDRLFSGTRA